MLPHRDQWAAGRSYARPLLGEAVSASTVSRLTQSLDAEVARLHRRPPREEVLYLVLYGTTLRVKTPAGVKRRLVLCAYALTAQGWRILRSFCQAWAESGAAWEAFLWDLYARGLEG